MSANQKTRLVAAIATPTAKILEAIDVSRLSNADSSNLATVIRRVRAPRGTARREARARDAFLRARGLIA